MNVARPTGTAPIIFMAVDQSEDQYRYRQAFGGVDPQAILYFFMHPAELIAALRSYGYPRPSLLIMDWNMARLGAYDLLATLARTTAWQTIPVVIMSRADRPADEDRCQQIGYGLVLPGETQPDKLVAQLTRLLSALL